MAQDAAPTLDDFVRFAKLKKEGFLSLAPRSGRAPLAVDFSPRKLSGQGALHCSFVYHDGVLYLGGEEVGPAHVKGLQQTLKNDGWFTITVALAGETVQVEGSRFDEVADDWAAMKQVLDRHPMTIPVQKKYDRIEELMKASPPSVKAIRKAMRVIEPDVTKLRSMRGGHGKTSEESDVRVNDKAKIARIRTAWTRLEPKVRTTPMTRKVREDFELMEKLVAAPDPDELALVATFERLADFVALTRGAAVKGHSEGDAQQKAGRQLLAVWQKEIAPELAHIIADWVKARGEGAVEARKLAALAKQFPQLLQGETPDLAKAKRTLAFFQKARTEAAAPRRAAG